MEAHEHITQQQPVAALAPRPVHDACEQCGAPVEPTQRYCVECGTRRGHVPDPAARFMSSATSRARATARAQQHAVGSGRPLRGVGLGTALAVALIPAGIGVGVVIGNSNNGSSDAGLIAALKAEKQQVVNVGVGGGAAGSTPAGSAGRGKSRAATHGSAKSASASSGSSTAGPSAVGYKPSASTLQTGAAVVAKEQKTVGKSYVGSQQGLPSVVSVP